MEGKDRPTELGKKKWEDLGKTVGIMLRICEPIFSTGKCVVLDSGFFVSKEITALLEFSFYASKIIKKPNYWPKSVPGDAIHKYFADKDVTHVDMLEAITEEVPEGKAFNRKNQGARLCHEDYGYMDDTGIVGGNRYYAEIQGAGWWVPRQDIQVSQTICIALPLPPPGRQPQQ